MKKPILTETVSPFAESNPFATQGNPFAEGVQPTASNVTAPIGPTAPVTSTPRFTVWATHGPEVLKPLLQSNLLLAYRSQGLDCFVGKFGLGEYEGFFNVLLKGGLKIQSIANSLPPQAGFKLRMIGIAMVEAQVSGLSDDSMALLYAACKGYVTVDDELTDEFTLACRAKRTELGTETGGVSLTELRARFEDGAVAKLRAGQAQRTACGQAWYQAKLAAEAQTQLV